MFYEIFSGHTNVVPIFYFEFLNVKLIKRCSMYIQINVHVKCYRQQAFGTLFCSALLENIRGGKNHVDTNEQHN